MVLANVEIFMDSLPPCERPWSLCNTIKWYEANDPEILKAMRERGRKYVWLESVFGKGVCLVLGTALDES